VGILELSCRALQTFLHELVNSLDRYHAAVKKIVCRSLGCSRMYASYLAAASYNGLEL
jgi:hypothetical protein